MRALQDKVFVAAGSFRTVNISCQAFLACQVSVERSAVNLIVFPIKVRDLLSLAALRIFSLSLKFASFTIKSRCWTVFIDFRGGSLYFLDLNACFPSQIRIVFRYDLFKYLFWPSVHFGAPGTPNYT